ncbi:hypothetical protein GWL_41600 [Herbaspirillum sp. GW103]|nr:hypothetical protein GWL_41600 [Herbaspirillum sp. GW103]
MAIRHSCAACGSLRQRGRYRDPGAGREKMEAASSHMRPACV